MINETILLQKYDKDIRRIVNRYLYSTQLSSKCSFYEDLISEAILAFLVMCRSFDLQSYNLSNLQRTMCKNKIESTLRVYIWKMFNMGGYNNKAIDLSRSITISDILRNQDLNIDDVAPNTYLDDFSKINVFDFLKTLTKIDVDLLWRILNGENAEEVSRQWNLCPSSIKRRLYRIRKKYINYEKTASAA